MNLWNWKEHLTTVPDAVKNLTVLLMEQEEGGLMTIKELLLEPLRKPFAGGTATVYPMPGRHNSAVEADAYLPEISTIGEHLCTAFLIANGAKLARTRLLSNEALVELYGAVKSGRRKAIAASGYTDRTFAVDNALRESLFFVNRHHKELFALTYPAVAQILDSRFEVPRWSAGAAAEARQLRGRSPMMKKLLVAGLGSLIAARMPAFPTNRPRRDAEDLVRLLAELEGMTAEQTQTAIEVTQTPPPSLFAPRIQAPRGATISAADSVW